ncbi:hypothetical protein M3Y99_00616900 [Aphelenchoides fujianensis]|nr:hypothetical protein M3Y99_00616900 [Aphelenchoides fujianensis]
MNGVKCRVESPCALELTQESPVMLLNMKHSWSYGNRPSELQIAPLITMITTIRMEDAGKMIQFFCRASGSNAQTTWSVMDAEDEHKFHPLANYPAVIDTTKTDDVSITLQCRAHNEAGEDVAQSTMILTDEASDMNDEEEEWEERK